MSTHENWSAPDAPKPSSDRTFGFVFTAFFTVLALLPLVRGHGVRTWALYSAAAFLLASLAAPKVLAPLNRIWTALGAVLHRITNPIILGAFFFFVFAPVGWVMRLAGKDFLHLKASPGADSYWIPRDPPGPEPESIAKQF
jgi:hypothetical protein